VSNTLKITNELAAACAERQRAGLSLREIAAWLTAKHSVSVSHIAVRAALQRHAEREAAEPTPAPAEGRSSAKAVDDTPAAPSPRRPPPAADGDASSGEPDVELLDKMIGELDEDIAAARRAGAVQALATLTRLQADLIERRRKLRPPPPVAVDDELLDAGRRAVEKLGKLLELELEKGAA
jgi:hypothetical protein